MAASDGPSAGYFVPFVGIVQYNGYRFPPAFMAKVQSRVVYNNSETAVKWVIHTFTIDTVISYYEGATGAALSPGESGDIAVNIEALRTKLSARGKEFIFQGQGFGDFYVNRKTATTPAPGAGGGPAFPPGKTVYAQDRRDLNYGPKPRIIAFEPIGSNRAWRLVWTCEICIPECDSHKTAGIIDASYESNYSINESGATSRTIRGTLEIAATLDATTSPEKLEHSVDEYLASIMPNTIDGFHREFNRTISRDHRRCDYTIQDTEIPTDDIFLKYMVNMQLEHTVESAMNSPSAGAFIGWPQSISGTLEWRAGTSGDYALSLMLYILNRRITIAVGSTYDVFDPAANVTKTLKASMIPISIRITEAIYERRMSFDFKYLSFFNLSFTNLLAKTGLFDKINWDTTTSSPTNTWAEWTTSLQEGNVQTVFGWQQLIDVISDDASQVTPCTGSISPGKVSNSRATITNGFTTTGVTLTQDCSEYQGANVGKAPFTGYDVQIRVNSKGNYSKQLPAGGGRTANITPAALDVITDLTATTFSKPYEDVAAGDIYNSDGNSVTAEPNYQVRGPTKHILEVFIVGTRWCHPVPIPNFYSFGGVGLKLVDQKVMTSSKAGIQPMYRIAVYQKYELPRLPTGNLHGGLLSNATFNGAPAT